MAQSTWSAEGTVWSGNSNLWSNDTYQVTASMTQTNFTQTLLEDTVFPRSLSMGSNFGMSGTGAQVMPAAIEFSGNNTLTDSQVAKMLSAATLATELGDFKTNINFEESATLAATSGISSDNNFLWNDVAEDEDTLWTKISDPDE
jgi:hypothetical protein